jgi:uncharacterized membrane protein YgcG
MPRVMKLILPLLAIIAMCGAPSPAQAAKYGVQDDGKFFSADTVTQAEKVIQQIRTVDDRDVLVMTYDKIPDDLKDKYNPDQKAKFYLDWADQIGKTNGVSGVVILITRDPKHIEIVVGNKTRQRQFTEADRRELQNRMVALLKDEKYDDGLLAGVKFIKERMDDNERHAQANVPPPAYPMPSSNSSGNSHVSGLLCLGIGLLIIVFMIISAANRNRGSGYGAPPPPGGYPPSYGGGYPQGGYPQGGFGGGFQGGGGGGGFGRGLLGGLLGGALGSWGYDKFAHGGGENPSYPPPQGGGADFAPPSDQTDTSFSGGGADFGSSNDSGGGGGADFGGGGDSGGGGGDFGGGGDSGGGGGGDF